LVLIQGRGSYGPKMLHVMAKYADTVSIGFGIQLDELRRKLAVLRAQCQILNRPYEQIEKITQFLAPWCRTGAWIRRRSRPSQRWPPVGSTTS
jgi:hypothetical protein